MKVNSVSQKVCAERERNGVEHIYEKYHFCSFHECIQVACAYLRSLILAYSSFWFQTRPFCVYAYDSADVENGIFVFLIS